MGRIIALPYAGRGLQTSAPRGANLQIGKASGHGNLKIPAPVALWSEDQAQR